MGKPLLTDEIIERANRGELFSDDSYLDDEETKTMLTDVYDASVSFEDTKIRPNDFDNLDNIKKSSQYIYKSRRIENAKRNKFQHKLNIIIVVVIILLIALFFAVFNL